MGLLRLLCPEYRLESVLDIPPDWIVRRGLRGVILDLDNTLVVWNQDDLQPEIVEWVEALKRVGLEVCIVSNSSGFKRVEDLSGKLGVKSVTLATKPSHRAYRLAFELMSTQPEDTVAIGDQMFTDVLGGNRLGLHTIMVRPMSSKDFVLTKLVRLIERVVLGVLAKQGKLKTRLNGETAGGEASL